MNSYQYLKRRRQYINKAGDVSIDTLVVLKNMENCDNCMVVAAATFPALVYGLSLLPITL
jgi:hypothetical protein